MIELCGFIPKSLPLYHYGSQCFGGFSGGNAQERTNFGRRPEALSQWLEYNEEYCIIFIKFSSYSNKKLLFSTTY
jgi:hypothetical protein